MIRFAVSIAIALSLLNSAAAAQTSDPACFSDAEFTDVLVSLAPALLNAMGRQCSAALPHGMVLGNSASVFANNLDAASQEAWPRMFPTVIRVMKMQGHPAGPKDFNMTREAFSAAVVPMFGKIITNPANCKYVDKILTLSEVLPPKNLAGILVQIIRTRPSDNTFNILCQYKP